MVEEKDRNGLVNSEKAEDWLSRVQDLVPVAVAIAKQVKGFSTRWKMITSKLEKIPPRLSDLSSHPCFSKNALCKEQLQSVVKTLNEVIQFADLCNQDKYEGKLQMQSDLDALCGKLDLVLKDTALLIKTGVLSEFTTTCAPSSEPESVRELLARLQIGHSESKTKALDTLVEIMKEDEKSVLSCIGRTNISSLVNLLSTTSPRIREKAVTIISSLVESGGCENWLISESVLVSLIRLVESGSPIAKEKATISLQRLSTSADAACAMVQYGATVPLLEACSASDSVLQAMAARTLKNLSAFPEVHPTLADEGVIRVMIKLLDCGLLSGSKEYAAECLNNLTASNESFQRLVIEEGGIRTLLAHLDCPLPQEPGVSVLRNLVGLVSFQVLDSLGFLQRLVHVLTSGSLGAKQAAASAICRVSTSIETKRMVAESGCIIPLLIKMLDAKSNGAREAASQALLSLMSLPRNQRQVKDDERSVPNLVQLLDPNPTNTAKKYAVACLEGLSSSNKCRKLMISYGAIGYLKKLTQMDVHGAKKLLDRLEKGKMMIGLFSRN